MIITAIFEDKIAEIKVTTEQAELRSTVATMVEAEKAPIPEFNHEWLANRVSDHKGLEDFIAAQSVAKTVGGRYYFTKTAHLTLKEASGESLSKYSAARTKTDD